MRGAKVLQKFNVLVHILKVNPRTYFSRKDVILSVESSGNIHWKDFAGAEYLTYLDKKGNLMTKNIAPATRRLRSYI